MKDNVRQVKRLPFKVLSILTFLSKNSFKESLHITNCYMYLLDTSITQN
jgi:hypothetical protein